MDISDCPVGSTMDRLDSQGTRPTKKHSIDTSKTCHKQQAEWPWPVSRTPASKKGGITRGSCQPVTRGKSFIESKRASRFLLAKHTPADSIPGFLSQQAFVSRTREAHSRWSQETFCLLRASVAARVSGAIQKCSFFQYGKLRLSSKPK